MTISAPDFDYICKMIRENAAIVLGPGKEYLVESRMASLIQQEGIASIEDLVKTLRQNPQNGLQTRVVEAMTTNETSFFRDIHPFNVLKDHVLPEIIEKNKDKRQINIWCGASSSGQEPYSLAMLIRQNFPKIIDWNITFIASDISHEMLDRCREGVYSQLEINRGLPAPMMVKFFQRKGTDWQIKDDLRKLVDFRFVNLCQDWPFMPPMDLVMMRNVLIYFDVEIKKEILVKVKKNLKPGGYLFLGAAETTINLEDSFERMNFKQSGCYRIKQD